MTRVLSLVTLILALLAAPLGAQTPPGGKVYRIAVVHPSLSVADMTEAKDPHFKAFFSELRRLGYVEGRNLLVERRSGEGHTARHPELAREVVRLQPDLIFVISARLTRGFQAATTTVPTVGSPRIPLVINLKTAKTLGLTIPPAVLARSDEVIQ
jgi:putative tryptophan/tyrosine transport system substrate-binding protein